MQLADVLIHVDEQIGHNRRAQIADVVRGHVGVATVIHNDEKPHLMNVKFDPAVVSARALLDIVRQQGVHAELVGL